MRVFLIIISVIMIYIKVVFSKTRTVKDLTDQCNKGRHIALYLTTGAGETDFYLGMIASTGKLNCTLNFFVTESHYVFMYIEFPDSLGGRKVCLPEVNSVTMVSGSFKIEICERLNLLGDTSYRNMAPNKIDLTIVSLAELSTVKMTVTSLRDPQKSKCTDKEAECLFNSKIFCMTKEARCDGFANCGLPNEYDEDSEECQGSRITPVVIIASIIMTIVAFWIVIAVIMALMPKRRETFVYKFDETMTVFDVEMGHAAVDINVEVLLPDEVERDPNKQAKHRSITKRTAYKYRSDTRT